MAHQIFERAASATASMTTGVYAEAVTIGTLSFLTMLLIMPPMCWHFCNRNIGATVLVGWVVILLLFAFINTLLWPNDDITHWYNGTGLCDVEVRGVEAAQVGLPAAFACVLKALAAVLDTDRITTIQTTAQRRRTYLIDLLWSVVLPCLQMLFGYVVSPHRYYIFGISGCRPAINKSWVTILLIYVPPFLWIVLDTYYASKFTFRFPTIPILISLS